MYPTNDAEAQPHKSYSWCAGLRVWGRRTATRGANHCASPSPPKAADQPLARGPGPTSHTLRASASVCGEGEPPREVHATACGTTPLHLRRNQQQTSPRHGGPGPQVIIFGRRLSCAGKANRRARSTPPPAVVHLSISVEGSGPASGLGPRVVPLGRWFLGAEKSNRRSRQCRASSGLPQKTEKVNFQNHEQRYRGTPRMAQ
jgi:hypothetical protein